MHRIVRISVLGVLVALIALAFASVSQAATTDTATVSSNAPNTLYGQPAAPKGTPITFTSTTPCTVSCGLTWKLLDGSRLGQQLGSGTSITKAFTTGQKAGADTYVQVQLDLSEPCVGSGGRLTCHSYATIYVYLT